MMRSLEDSNVLTYGITKTVKNEIKKQEGEFLPAWLVPLASSLLQPIIYSVVKGISGREIRRAGRRYRDQNV